MEKCAPCCSELRPSPPVAGRQRHRHVVLHALPELVPGEEPRGKGGVFSREGGGDTQGKGGAKARLWTRLCAWPYTSSVPLATSGLPLNALNLPGRRPVQATARSRSPYGESLLQL